MKIYKVCGIEKSLKEYTSYTNYQATAYRHTCRKYINKKIRGFKNFKIADRILELLVEEYDLSWSGKGTIIFNKAEKVVHTKYATNEMSNLIFARYCSNYFFVADSMICRLL